MHMLCPVCEDPSKNLWVNISEEKEYGYGRFAGSSTVYVVEDVEQTCDCDLDEYGRDRLDEKLVEDYLR